MSWLLSPWRWSFHTRNAPPAPSLDRRGNPEVPVHTGTPPVGHASTRTPDPATRCTNPFQPWKGSSNVALIHATKAPPSPSESTSGPLLVPGALPSGTPPSGQPG